MGESIRHMSNLHYYNKKKKDYPFEVERTHRRFSQNPEQEDPKPDLFYAQHNLPFVRIPFPRVKKSTWLFRTKEDMQKFLELTA